MLRIEQELEEPIEFLLHKQFFFCFVLNNFRFFRCVCVSVVFPILTFIYLIYLTLQFFEFSRTFQQQLLLLLFF